MRWRVAAETAARAARDGKRIQGGAEAALAPITAMHDAAFGLGLYRYYADIAPSALKFLRWLLLLPRAHRKGLAADWDARERARGARRGRLPVISSHCGTSTARAMRSASSATCSAVPAQSALRQIERRSKTLFHNTPPAWRGPRVCHPGGGGRGARRGRSAEYAPNADAASSITSANPRAPRHAADHRLAGRRGPRPVTRARIAAE